MAKGDMSQLGRQGGMQNMGNMGIGNMSGFGSPPPQNNMGMQQGMGGLRGMLGQNFPRQFWHQPMQPQMQQNKAMMRDQVGGRGNFNQMMSPFTQYNAQNAAMNNFMGGNIRSGSGLQSNMDVMSPIMSGYGQQQQPAGEMNAQMPMLPSYGGIQQSQGGYQNPRARY